MNELFWTSEGERVGEDDFPKKQSPYRHIPFGKTPTMEHYRRALVEGLAPNPEKEKYIRTQDWWTANDPVRHGETSTPVAPDFHENLRSCRSCSIQMMRTSD